MILWKRLAYSCLSCLAFSRVRLQWKNAIVVPLPSSTSELPSVTTIPAQVDDKNVTEVVEPSANDDYSSSNSTQSVETQVPTAKLPDTSQAESKMIRKAVDHNATKATNFSVQLPVAVKAANNPPLRAVPLSTDPKLYFIHVGKAGGLTLNQILDIEGKWKALQCVMEREKQHDEKNTTRLLEGPTNASSSLKPCYKASDKYPSQLSQHLVSHLHLRGVRFSRIQRRWILDHTDTFLFLIRDPIKRLVSAYNFHRHNFANTTKPRRKLFYETCFPNGMNELVNQLARSSLDDDYNATRCRNIAVRALRGGTMGSGGGNHFDMNYGFYASRTIDKRPNHTVTVVRTEYMWDDIITLDKALGGTGNFSNNAGTKVSHGSESWKGKEKYNSYLSSNNLQLLCCYLHVELDVYQRVILLAANLNPEQKKTSLTSLLEHCQIDYAGDPVAQPFSWESYYDSTCAPMIPMSTA